MSNSKIFTARQLRRTTLALSLGLGLGLAGTSALAQNVTGAIFGQISGQHGDTVTIRNVDTGLERTAPVDSTGRYRFSSLPTGNYTVTLQNHGEAVTSRDHVMVTIAGGTEVSFGAPAAAAKTLEGVSVVASALPAIDVSSVDTRTVMTAEQLQKLPVGRDISSVALLAPGVIQGSSYTGAPSFGGSAASENAYYINGYPVTNPLTSIGFSTLPFDAIDQEQVLTGGYGAEFGRSTGGVINIVTKRGTNKWKAGVYTIWQPESLRSTPHNIYFANTGFYGPGSKTPTDGTIYARRARAQYWTSTVGGHVSGPLIQDKLFFYADMEMNRQEGSSVRYYSNSSAPQLAQGWNDYTYKMPRWTAKIDWNINDSNILELTGISDKTQYDAKYSPYSYATDTHSGGQTAGVYTKDGGEVYVGKYTGYITDDLTVTALYGTQKITHYNSPFGYDPNCPYISSTTQSQAPGLTYSSCQRATTVLVPKAHDKTYGGRFDIEYRIGDHDIRLGLDKQAALSLTGSSYAGGYAWIYGWQGNPNGPIDESAGVASPASAGGLGSQGYYVYRYYNTQLASVKTQQSAQYIEDRWQVNDRVLLSLGLRNEQFTNYNGDNQPYASQRHQLAPRLGVTWDVFGDSTLKVFANAGRYHLAMPNNVAVRGASGSLITSEYFTYTGVDPKTGVPTGLTPVAVDRSKGHNCGNTNAVSTNLECGEAPDPRTVAAKGLKSHFQDEYILGAEYQLSPSYVVGAKATVRKLRSAIDDTCTPALGGRCFLFNPGQANTFLEEQDDGSFEEVTYTNAQLGFPRLKRKYAALDLFLEHPFSNNWYGKIDYTFSHNYGNTEGQLSSDLDTGSGGQSDVSVTQDWDLPYLMAGSNGTLPNNRTHQLRAFGYYQLSKEWRFGATLQVASGRPRSCLSFWPDASAPGLYNSSTYHYCGLPIPGSTGYVFTPRGTSGTTPWTYKLDINAAYTPSWADNKLTLQVDVFNIFNRRTPLYYYERYATNRSTVNAQYGRVLDYSSPRTVRFTARYDF